MGGLRLVKSEPSADVSPGKAARSLLNWAFANITQVLAVAGLLYIGVQHVVAEVADLRHADEITTKKIDALDAKVNAICHKIGVDPLDIAAEPKP